MKNRSRTYSPPCLLSAAGLARKAVTEVMTDEYDMYSYNCAQHVTNGQNATRFCSGCSASGADDSFVSRATPPAIANKGAVDQVSGTIVSRRRRRRRLSRMQAVSAAAACTYASQYSRMPKIQDDCASLRICQQIRRAHR